MLVCRDPTLQTRMIRVNQEHSRTNRKETQMPGDPDGVSHTPMEPPSQLRKVAFLGDYLPRRCGIATFTADLRNAISTLYPKLECPVVAVSDRDEGYDYPQEVRFEIPWQEAGAYQRAADFLNLSNIDVLSVQHEFGIYGGPSGSHILALMRAVRMPIVTTMHTVLKEPTREQRRIFSEVLGLSSRVVVMAERGAEFLRDIYGLPDEKLDIIPHGIPDVPFTDPTFFKDQFGVEGKQVLLTFGLLSPNKGIENVLNALPDIVSEFPDVVYIVLGATHPNLVREQGEIYRLSLERLAKKNGVDRNVIFFNQFVGQSELTEFIGAADIYITPYLNEAQITSGTLAYSFGAGKAVISTPYWHAQELLADGRGVLVPFADSAAVAGAVKDMLRNETQRHSMRKNAYLIGRDMVWSNVAHLYASTFSHARREDVDSNRKTFHTATLEQRDGGLPTWRFDHLLSLTDHIGIFQHSIFTVPDYNHGYCTDDNARALILMTLLQELGEKAPGQYSLTGAYAAFLQYAFNPDTGRFRNFMGFNRTWLEDVGSEDSHGRALWALGTCVGRSGREDLRGWAASVFEFGLAAVENFTSPRAWAFTILGVQEYLRTLSGDRMANRFREELSNRLMDLFRRVSSPEWMWFEDTVTYDNAKISHALILAGQWTNRSEVLDVGLNTLRWLAKYQTGPGGCFRPIGSEGFWQKGKDPAPFDQQPVEAHAMVSACLEAYGVTQDAFWLREAHRAFDWFLGANDLGIPVYDPQTGGCHDGLHVDRVNQNEGAESTLAFLLSLAEMKRVRNLAPSFIPA